MEISRRRVLRQTLALAAGIGCAKHLRADELVPLRPEDPEAMAFGFVQQAEKVDAAAHPTFQAGQRCATCSQYEGAEEQASGGCAIFAGRSVPAGAWCKVWAPR